MTARAVQRWVFLALLVLLGILVVTGVWLTFRYRPRASPVWNDLGIDLGGTPVAQLVHRWSAQLAWLVAIGLMTVTLVLRIAERDRSQPWGLTTATVPLLLALSITGYLLPWDQLGLWAVTVGTDLPGVLDAAFSDQVRFLIIDNAEVTQETYRAWFLIHAAVLTLAVVAVVVVLAPRLRRAPGAPRPSSDSPGSA